MATFTFSPSYSSAAKVKVRIKKTQFGDGYMQRGADGINAVKRDWALGFNNISDTLANDIESFLAANVAANISWTPPGYPSALKYICTEWSRTYGGFNNNSISFVFEQVFE